MLYASLPLFVKCSSTTSDFVSKTNRLANSVGFISVTVICYTEAKWTWTLQKSVSQLEWEIWNDISSKNVVYASFQYLSIIKCMSYSWMAEGKLLPSDTICLFWYVIILIKSNVTLQGASSLEQKYDLC